MKDVPVLCLTATATEMVVSDVCDSLSLGPVVLRGPTDRPNLFYEVRHKGSDSEVAEAIATLILTEFKDSSGIVYVLSRKDAEELAHSLSFGYGIRAGFYHGDVSSTERGRTYSRWIEGSLQVICATISFGLGIDKQDCA
jgi:superfamily II DNA helicase RecQ